jgi:predicted transcriptional regulator
MITRKNLILNILFNLKEANTTTIYRLMGLRHRTDWNNIISVLKQLMANGYITRTRRGVYSITEKGIKRAIANRIQERVERIG